MKNLKDVRVIFCENLFEKLSEEDPELLRFYIVECDMSIGNISIALPYLSKNPGYIGTILDFTRHKSAIVREGAMHALWNYAIKEQWYKECLLTFKYMSEFDESETIRKMAEDFYLELTENKDYWLSYDE